ncbi:peptidase domain-containing ABC transporter [Magnetococcales bacterium HHB-1]
MKASQEHVRYILETNIMFNMMPDADKRFLQTLFEQHTYNPGDTVVEQNRPMDGFYYIYDGKVRLLEENEQKRRSLGYLEKEASFGETALFKEDKWAYNITAIEPTIIFKLPREKILPSLQANPEMEQHFRREAGFVSFSLRLRALLGDQQTNPCSPKDFSYILHNIGIKRIAAGKNIFSQNHQDPPEKEGPRLYLIESGEVELIRQPVHGDPIVLDRHLGPGRLVGESAAIDPKNDDGRYPHTARALTDVTVLIFAQPLVQKILEINPALHEQLRSRSKGFILKEQQELAKKQLNEGIEQRIKLKEGVTEEEFLALQKETKTITTFPVVNQRTDSEAAAACLAMITHHHRKKEELNLAQIVELSKLTGRNITPQTIVGGSELLGYRAAAYAINFDELKTIQLPGIIGWENYHYMVLYKITDKEVFLADPVEGLKTLSKEEFIRSWTEAEIAGTDKNDPERGLFIALVPTTAFFELKIEQKKPLSYFIGYMLPYKKFFMDALVGSLILNLLGLATPLFTQTIVDTVVVHSDRSLLNMMLGGMVLVAIFRTLTTGAQSLILAHTTARIDMKMMSEFYRHVLSLPMSFFLTRNKGDILTRFGDNAKIRAIIAGSTITVILSTLMMFIYLFMMFGYSKSLSLITLFFIPIYIVITLYFTPRIKNIAKEMAITNANSQSALIESLNGIETLKATANEHMARFRWENFFVDNVNKGFQMQRLGLTSNSLNQLTQISSQVAILWVGANEVMDNQMTIGELMGFQMLMGMVMGPITQIIQLWNSSQDVRISIDRVSEILEVKPEQDAITKESRIPAAMDEQVKGRIIFDKVNFSYSANGKENHIMKDFELVVEPGDRVAFVGAAGCGKSTIAKMILGFNMPHPSGGACTIDGKDIRELNLAEMRRQIGVVLQHGFLFAGTVAENIALGDPEPNMIAVKESARLAGADEFITKMAMGYNTPVGERGQAVSGGQLQRICIARALYRSPKIMIFDEATSALDNRTEALVQKNIKDILVGRTSFTIAHRLNTIIDSDYICYIKDGKVAEKGSHDQLTNVDFLREQNYSGLYYRLAQSQFTLDELPDEEQFRLS